MAGNRRARPSHSTECCLQKRGFGFYSKLRSEFCNYAVGPWVSVAERETALARGNPAKKMEQWSWSDELTDFVSLLITPILHDSITPEKDYANPLRSF